MKNLEYVRDLPKEERKVVLKCLQAVTESVFGEFEHDKSLPHHMPDSQRSGNNRYPCWAYGSSICACGCGTGRMFPGREPRSRRGGQPVDRGIEAVFLLHADGLLLTIC